ncbi:hypothetical protein PC116_g26736 [Phytophthora cactorum]|uniref:Glutaredoxin domain-containing protein n=1 Tax=Phytophthora cactorum TaxID=29920 RepID=A0A8T0Y4P7_9STRA|nr:hypothetical protein PC111_g22026 [Phytophthora cactorum]KAG2826661.1 hypothetical protein PC113_g21732 [Phytophthora cactorum]KAG2878528.1 hypothetical protein PC115_g23039 [Phytophthora cactorum]KAG2959147.1 hypothetical protein PC118_g23168 [Phytophthora cactorum]KAG3052846.1 hypothetical protein PC122_g22522 [Phytophthora cactorum]
MKDTPSKPKCGFKTTVKFLRDHQMSSLDISSDEQVRQRLKKFSILLTYPQLEQLGAEKKSKKENKYEQLINRARVMTFIKGTPQLPQCGFSRELVDILCADGFKYDYFEILPDDSVRQGLKKYSNWPTFPLLYVNGELIGGLNIV